MPGFADKVYPQGSDKWMQKVWDLHKRPDIPGHERLVLLTTFDNVMLMKKNFLAVADAMARISREMTRSGEDPGSPRVQDGGHYPEQAEALRRLARDADCVAACWDQTSVADDGWIRYDTCPTCGQNEEEYRMFDLSRDSGHWFMLESDEESTGSGSSER